MKSLNLENGPVKEVADKAILQKRVNETGYDA